MTPSSQEGRTEIPVVSTHIQQLVGDLEAFYKERDEFLPEAFSSITDSLLRAIETLEYNAGIAAEVMVEQHVTINKLEDQIKGWRWLHWGQEKSWICDCANANGHGIQTCATCGMDQPKSHRVKPSPSDSSVGSDDKN